MCCIIFQDAHNLLQKRDLGVSRDGRVNTAAADPVFRGAASVLHDSIHRRRDVEQHHLG